MNMIQDFKETIAKEAAGRYKEYLTASPILAFIDGASFYASLTGDQAASGLREALAEIMGIINETGYDSGSMPHKYSKIDAIAREALSTIK